MTRDGAVHEARGLLFAPPPVALERRDDGTSIVRSTRPLGPYANDVGIALERWARLAPERTFLAERDGEGWRRTSYAETLECVRRLASALLALGLDERTPVAILSENSLAHAWLSLAAMYGGIPAAPVSPAYATAFGDLRRLRAVLGVLEPALAFAEDGARYADALALLPVGVRRVARTNARDAGAQPFAELLAHPVDGGALATARARIGPDTVAKILFTSGSTSEPKGVINTHRMLCSNQRSIANSWPFFERRPPLLVDWLPWHHTFGGNHNFNAVLFNGGTLYVDDGRPAPGRFARTLENLRGLSPTAYLNVPRGHALLVDALEGDDAFAATFFAELDVTVNAAAALPEHTWRRLDACARRARGCAVPVVGAWGSTETSPMATCVAFETTDSANVGVPGDGTEVLLVPGVPKTEARVRGPLVTPGYWKRPDLTARAFDAEGFYRMGDALRFVHPDEPARGLAFDGRIVENFKLSTGTWVDAGTLRTALLSALAPLVDDVVVGGENRDEVAVLLFPSAAAKALDTSGSAMSTAPAVRAAFDEALARHNETATASSLRVERFGIADEPLLPAEGEVTDKGSVNQLRVLERRSAVFDALFETDAARVGAPT